MYVEHFSLRLLVHAVNNGVEKNAKWRVSPNCFCSLSTIRGVFYDNVRFIYLYCRRGIDKIIVSFPNFKICKMDCYFYKIQLWGFTMKVYSIQEP